MSSDYSEPLVADEQGESRSSNTIKLGPITLDIGHDARGAFWKGVGCCSVLGLVTFLLCFFLIPRTPIVRYSTWHMEIDVESMGVQLTQSFSITNPNYYAIDWSKLDLKVYHQGTEIARVSNSDRTVVPSKSSKDFPVAVQYTGGFREAAKLAADCHLNGLVLDMKGTLKAHVLGAAWTIPVDSSDYNQAPIVCLLG